MLQVQEYLRSGKTFDDLKSELGIKTTFHPTFPLAILNYNQIDSPKTNIIARECRGLTLHSQTFELVAPSMYRFFNWGEVVEEMPSFDFSDFVALSKEDGSLVSIYNWNDQWFANTRGSFGLDLIQFQKITWQEGFCQALDISSLQDIDLNPGLTYICEFCSVWNKIVRRYEKPGMYLLTVFEGGKELPWSKVRALAAPPFKCPDVYDFKSIEEIKAFLEQRGQEDPTFEGVVIRDRHDHRWKIKSALYFALHHLRGEGNNLFNPKHILPFVLAGETAELLNYFPEATKAVEDCQAEVDASYSVLKQVWQETHKILDQKKFALAIVGRTPFTGVLFTLRKEQGDHQTVDGLQELWRGDSAKDLMLKILKRKYKRCVSSDTD